MKQNIKLLTGIICLFLLFAASLTIYTMHREEKNHIDLLQTRLQDYNNEVHDLMQISNSRTPNAWDEVVKDSIVNDIVANDSVVNDSVAPTEEWKHLRKDIRLTVIDLQGNVLYESTDSVSGEQHANHLNREEVQKALADGQGYAVIRSSQTTGKDYFYSATRYDDCIIRSAMPYNTELRQSLSSDRHYIYAAIFISLVLIGLFFYITHRMGITESDNATLQTKLKFEQEYNQYKYELSHNIAHELKTPVASIQGYLETILDARAKGNITEDQITHFLERSYSQSQRLNSLVQDISTLNHMTETRQVEKEQIDVYQLLTGILDEVALKLELQQMTVHNKLPRHLMIECNQSAVYSIFRNLIDNSIAYAGVGSEIQIGFYRDPVRGTGKADTTYYFSFADNGQGVPEETLQRIFERFYRVDKGRSRKSGGTGLGLAIVKNAVLLHGGSINARNREGGGLEFIFSLIG